MIPIALGDVAAATGGRLTGGADPAAVVSGVVIDSRAASGGDLFAAVPGERVDGHDYAATALGAGAVAVLAERDLGDDVPAVVVPGRVLDALPALAAEVLARRHQLPTPFDVVGVTGSSGKTSTKDLLAAVLAPLGPVVAPPGSFNNELGVPLTLLRVDEQTRTLVVEMGARGIGHIAHLCELAHPRVGAVLNVGSAHVGEFGSPEAIAVAKGELVEALPPAAEAGAGLLDGGVAVLNADDHRVAAMATRTRARVLTFGWGASADVRAEDVRVDELGRPAFALHAQGASAQVSMQLHGEHHVSNALAAAACALAVGVELDDVAAALSTARAASRWRMEVTERPDGVVVVNDAYNANPESVRAALRALKAMHRPGGRTWAVIGEMLELGDTARDEHDAVGRYAVRLDISRLVAVGKGARPVHTGAVLEGSYADESMWVADIEAAEALLAQELRPGDVVLVKSSNGAGLMHLGDRLALAGAAPVTSSEGVRA
ncbi:UDP-N-acetylmuramoyl-tripeptide--D-alanyl-D-alanine ligase [Quadrisphaera granulorum]|uniref:UDP-N-acetylmuramoyl-tripeptide--D-alanyl-D-alanine ligase n=1 Tax=Quadrisphaera granulorum TaxID=317664 RepID=A0A316A9K5_9ACTN|nr:UDP-N-acetylmuramoyl-tripeptide--D-alanyl-D-alanine ligase [Quadrisphaera granulorum]PWJ53680.1 UDP-N-acetylmuramoyl-tripeptide--D-alanyl-D-alanine ligase [Quadrisphaera granulorum]SZE96724.1 UDP-N-acetylmuramoyl-tripeptide--D-alanyl-D-alanine ligase [Quadrisphaera granulorum]